jgi:arylsulfatase A-like enzyme
MPRGKQWPYDSGLHIPCILYIPPALAVKGYAAGSVTDQITESIDLTATTLALAGVEKPAKMQGRVFLGPGAEKPRQYAFGFRDRGDETVDRIRSVRDARFRYIRNFYPQRPFLQLNRYKETSYPIITVMRYLHEQGKLTGPPETLMAPTRPAEELYDLDNDPYEIHNLARDPKYVADLSRLRGVLNQWIEDVNDQGRYPEPPEVTEHYEQQSIKSYITSGRLEKARAEVLEQIKAAESK